MKYVRTFVLTASHFNGAIEYAALERARDVGAVGLSRLEAWEELARGTHGHNFELTITIDVRHLDRDGFAVDDVAIERIVREWDNVNLSLHPDFNGMRATTENMVELLLLKLSKLNGDGRIRLLQVRVQETRDIYAEGEWRQ